MSPLFLHSPHVSQVCSEHLGSWTSAGQEAGLSQHCCYRGSAGLEWPVSMSGGPCASPSSPCKAGSPVDGGDPQAGRTDGGAGPRLA